MLAALDDDAKIHETGYSQVVIFSVEFALAALWTSWSAEAAVVAGHSVGDVVAATLAGCMDLRDALRLVYARGQWMAASEPGRMLLLECSRERAEALLIRYKSEEEGVLGLAAVNGPDQTLLSGEGRALEGIMKRLRLHEDIKCKLTNAVRGFHSKLFRKDSP